MSNIDKKISDKDFFNIIQKEYDKAEQVGKIVNENKELQAIVQNKVLKAKAGELQKSETLKNAIDSTDVLDREFNIEVMEQDIIDRANAITCLNTDVSNDIIFAPHSIFLFAGMTNNGKSTFVAHIVEPLVSVGKKVVVLSNEETEQDYFARVSCLRLGISFGDYKANKCSADEINKIKEDTLYLTRNKLLTLISTKDDVDAYRTTTVEGVVTTLLQLNGRVDCVLIDYMQNIQMTEMGTMEPWHCHNLLANKINNIKSRLSYPLIMMAQCEGLKPDDKGNLNLESNHPMYRWKGGKAILTVATDIIEIVRDFENSLTHLFLHKVRFSHGDLRRGHILGFDKKKQKYVKWTPEFDMEVTRSKIGRLSRDKEKELGLDKVFNDKKT